MPANFSDTIPNSPPIGALQPADLSYGAAVGSAAQFVVVYDAATDQTALNWDQNGADPSGGVYGLAIFDGNLTLLYTDILII